ncbi:MAG: CoA transferase [Chloroflexi bacterium]|nr:CoA transferase [Chloroflexota bacterium]
MPEGLLSGLKVLDLGRHVAGPYCAKLMAGLGAEVVKVERPGRGDPARRVGPFPGDVPHPEKSALFLYLNTGKKGVTLNLTTPTGRELFKRLVEWADVLVENFSPGVLPSLGLDYPVLAAINPGLVRVSISAFGQTGPHRDHRAQEINLYAAGGLMYITGDLDREPLQEGARLSQYGAGQNAFVAALSAIWGREITGEGQHVDVSIAEYNVSILENLVTMYTYKGDVVVRTGNRGYGRAAWGIYPCRDGHVGIIAAPDHRWPAMAQLMGIEELADPRFGTRYGRQQHADEIDARMLPWLLEHDRLEIFKGGQERGLAFSYVATPEDTLKSEHLRARQFFVPIEHPVAGGLEYPVAPFRASEGELRSGPAPLLGQHNQDVYCRLLGYTPADLNLLYQLEVI